MVWIHSGERLVRSETLNLMHVGSIPTPRATPYVPEAQQGLLSPASRVRLSGRAPRLRRGMRTRIS